MCLRKRSRVVQQRALLHMHVSVHPITLLSCLIGNPQACGVSECTAKGTALAVHAHLDAATWQLMLASAPGMRPTLPSKT